MATTIPYFVSRVDNIENIIATTLNAFEESVMC